MQNTHMNYREESKTMSISPQTLILKYTKSTKLSEATTPHIRQRIKSKLPVI